MVMLTGGCHCGHVRYELAGSPCNETNCHCSICRRTSGAPFVAWFSIRTTDFRIVRGEPAQYESSAKATRAFCPRCGTQLTFQHVDHPDELDVTTCSLDAPQRVPPKDHIFTSSKLGWIVLADRLPQFGEARP
jgi:hypothetical protein